MVLAHARSAMGDDSAREALERGDAARTLQAEAAAISDARVANGDPGGDECDKPKWRDAGGGRMVPESEPYHYVKPSAHEQHERSQADSKMLRKHRADTKRAEEKAEEFDRRVEDQHGVKKRSRPIQWGAWFDGEKASQDKNGDLALEMVSTSNIPDEQLATVFDAALRPTMFVPKRDVMIGKRSDQKRFKRADDNAPGLACRMLHDHNDNCALHPDWADPWTRTVDHPQAIKVFVCAAFAWRSKIKTTRGGFAHKGRGNGGGVFAAMLRCSKETLFGHSRGVPGAMLALKLAGFFQYGQPPCKKVDDRDTGRTGHAFNMYWWIATAAEKALQVVHAEVARLGRLPTLIRLDHERRAAEAVAARAPPRGFTDADIPY